MRASTDVYTIFANKTIGLQKGRIKIKIDKVLSFIVLRGCDPIQ